MIRLEHPDLSTLVLGNPEGIHVESFDAPLPAVRANVSDRPAVSGSDDFTRLFGARTISMTLHVEETAQRGRQATLDLLRAYCSPRRRPWLYVDLDDAGTERRIKVRGSDLGAPITVPGYAAVQLSLVAPEGVFEAATLSTVTASAAPASEAGRRYPKVYPYRYSGLSLAGAVDVVNSGTEPASPIYRLWGPVTDPQLVNVDTGDQMILQGLSLTADQYAEIDVANYTVLLNGRTTDSLYGYLDVLNSAFGYLAPGSNRIRYAPRTYSDTARAEILFRPAWL